MIVRTFFRQREDGTNLYRTYSDKNMIIRQIETDTLYSEAVDVENAPYSYEETEIPIDKGDRIVEEWQAEQERKMQEEINKEEV